MNRIFSKRARSAHVLALAVSFVMLAALPAAAGTGFAFDFLFGSSGSGDGQFLSPLGTEMGYNGVYVADYGNNRIQIFTDTGTYSTKWGSSGTAANQFGGPIDLAINRWGTIYVSEYGNNRIQIFSQSRTYLGMVGANGGDGTSGSANGEFDGPLGIAVGPDNRVYVADGDNDRIQKLDGEGIWMYSWGSTGTGNGQFNRPWGIAISDDGLIFVTDYENNRVQVFDLDGVYLYQWGSFGSLPGQFDGPTGIDIDPQNNVVVAEYGNHRVQVFTQEGDLITWFGSYGTNDGQFDGIDGICLDGARGAWVPDYYNNRVQKWSWEQSTETNSVSGTTRFDTAIAASVEGWPNGLENSEDGMKTAIVTTGRNWPDALGGAGLAGAIDAPILLVEPNALPPAVATELTRLDAEQVYILGGAAAVSTSVEQAILDLPGMMNVERFGGANRYETALLIAAEVTKRPSYEGSAFVATGLNFPDALAAAPVAAYNGFPIYLTPPDSLPDSVKDQLAADTFSDTFILGGTNAISGTVMDDVVAALPGLDVDRVSGASRYETALAVTSTFGYEGANWHLTWNHVALATGRDFPDALAGGPVQGRARSFMLLTSGTTLEAAVASALADHKDEIYEIRYLGGTAVIEPDVRASAEALLW